MHNDSPDYSPTEDEADDQEPNATDNGGEAELEPMANGTEVGNDGADTGQVVVPILFDLTFDDAAGQFVRPVVPEFSFMQFAELGQDGRRDVVHGAALAESLVTPLSVRSETAGANKFRHVGRRELRWPRRFGR